MKLLAVLLLVAAAPAWAQSKRYPPDAVDKELDREKHSTLWDQALHPGSADYLVLLDQAVASLKQNTQDERSFAIEKLGQAIKILPERPEAYALRGHAYFLTSSAMAEPGGRKWAECANDLAAAEEHISDSCAVAVDETCVLDHNVMQRELGLCLGRAGRFAEAERTFAALTSATLSPRMSEGEIWMRLGEVRIAMGKLDEAISALRTALDRTPDGLAETATWWLLAGAYDRSRKPSEVLDALTNAARNDPTFATIVNADPPLLPGEVEYLLAIGYLLTPNPHPEYLGLNKPEYALVYLRRFITEAPEGPWRKRAEEHLREVTAMQLPAYVSVVGVSANRDAARPSIARAMPAMRTCVAKVPDAIIGVTIVQNGPRTTERPFLRLAAPGVRAQSMIPTAALQPDLDAAALCVQKVAEGIKLPPVKETDSQRQTTFYVVSP